ncbi:hypothetical protein PV04_02009 [Phialophora macrospora]|uniref:Major facilitator superfamily (MFS) profile domain-containing protein n=1 Tax=Phialophora macrospora TaxID=1851006 RepID=A0A0D2G571_9EURO|nr:hypothetical protein PV04_02009 [Phialophora macrospora]
MGLGVLEANTTAHVPGTVLLDQQAAHSEDQTGRLKHGTGRNSNMVLAPQPSEDPNDPLNWSPLKKHIVLGVIFFGVIIIGVIPGPLLNAGIIQISVDLNRSPTDVAKLSGYCILATGAMGPFASALGRKYGKRPMYVFSSLIGTIGIIVSEAASGYNTLLAGRVLQGIGIAAYESLAVSSIGDIFFVHERGPRVAVVIFLLAAISNGISIIAGVITEHLGWQYNFHIYIPFAALQTIAVILYCPETMYRRKAIYETDTAGSDENLEKLAKIESAAAHHGEKVGRDLEKTMTSTSQASIDSVPPKKTWVQELSLYNGTFVDDSVFKMAIASVAILLNVGATYQVFMTGIIIAWYVAVAILSGVIFASPPYLLSSASVGYMSVGPFIGGLVGAIFSLVISEPLVKSMAKRNKGVYEPEFALLPVGLGGACSVAGLIGWGYAVNEFKNIYLVCFIWGVILFGMTVVASFATQWALDAYRQNSTELFIMNMVFKNFFFYGLTNYVIDWYLTQGAVDMAGTMAGITGFLCLLAIPMYIYGKKYRYFWHKHNALKWLHLETDHAGSEG